MVPGERSSPQPYQDWGTPSVRAAYRPTHAVTHGDFIYGIPGKYPAVFVRGMQTGSIRDNSSGSRMVPVRIPANKNKRLHYHRDPHSEHAMPCVSSTDFRTTNLADVNCTVTMINQRRLPPMLFMTSHITPTAHHREGEPRWRMDTKVLNSESDLQGH